jgi:hypothetical protein
MKSIRLLFLLFLIIVFLAGIYWIFNSNMKENLDSQKKDTDNKSSCPNMLIQKGDVLLLYNSNKPTDENNPIPFTNLDEYIYYLEAQRKLGNECPILYLTQETNTQGKDVFRIRPSPFDLQGGLPTISNSHNMQNYPPLSISNTHKTYQSPSPTITDINNLTLSAQRPVNTEVVNVVDASRENGLYNSGNYAGFDPTSQYIGVFTNIDAIHNSTEQSRFSDNPMDANWGGVEYTQQMIDTGKYEENNINKPILFQPKTAFSPINNGFPPPKDII